ncbi:hypothetical protein SAMN05660461_4676 [Chitinophaga ginsengisegetis]|uniref:Uncharacterized protein n=1 Tax=Chitinophaga ginsengisegetis TaxID=393003 RepID=A0A1T5P976_9BACT|nr:hypothetical protein [Chitinophaga ginsengisegetis]SKD08799.1 hypothetical protein SAMN05660461_4676 [Chitinophaga ginsengisegetis]
MQSPLTIFVFNQNPFRLSEEEYHSPETVLKNYFELFGPGETNDILTSVQTEALTNPGSPYSAVSERMKVMSCFTELYRLIEAAFVISQKK